MYQNKLNLLMLDNHYKGAPPKIRYILRKTDVRIDIEPGWYNLIEEFLSEFNKINSVRLEITNIKQKLGGLRIYYTKNNSKDTPKRAEVVKKTDSLIREYEDRAYKICEFCGIPKSDVKHRKIRNWIWNSCEKCINIKKEKNS